MKIVVNVHLAAKLADHGRMELFGNGGHLGNTTRDFGACTLGMLRMEAKC